MTRAVDQLAGLHLLDSSGARSGMVARTGRARPTHHGRWQAMSFTARYDGVCASDCDSRIHLGDEVRYNADRQLVHDACTPAPDPLTIGPREIVCGVCWLVKPCRCDD